MRYPALIEGGGDGYGVVFPDLPGCVAMGHTLDEAIRHAEEALHDWMDSMEALGHQIPSPSELEDIEVTAGCTLTSILVVRAQRDKPSVRLNLVLDAGVADAITSEAKRRGLTRKAYIERVMRSAAQMGA